VRLAFSTNAYVRYPLEEAIQSIARLGYDGVEILADRPHAFLDEEWDAGDHDNLKAVLSAHGLSVSNINANTARGFFSPEKLDDPFEPSLSNPDKLLRRWRIDYTKRCIDLASSLGSRSVSVTSGPDASVDRGVRMGLFMESLEEILEYSSGQGVFIGIEYEPGLLIGDAWKTFRVLDIFQSPYLGVNLDIGHACVLGEDLGEVIHLFGSGILNIHIEDIKDRRHFHLIPGLGDIDFDSFIRALKDIDYDHYLTVELYTYSEAPAEAAAEALAFFRKRFPILKGEGNENN